MQKHYYFTTILLLCSFLLHATHNRSGEITFRKTGGLGVEATITTYTKASSINADRDSLDICWGDGTCTRIARSNGTGIVFPGQDLKKNIYIGTHTYAASGEYQISMTDMNRTGGIINVNPPSSDNVPFHLESSVRLLPDAVSSISSPVFLEFPIDAAYTFQPFSHIVNAFDPDGDSLVFALVTPMQGLGSDVPNYSFPDQISPSQDNKIFMNPVTGEFFWDSPIQPGVYCIAILVKAYRNGILVESIRRDMSIEVSFQTNHAPEITLTPDIDPAVVMEVTVGQTVAITVNATDIDAGQVLALTASGGPFSAYFQEKATFVVTGNTGLFTWKIDPEYLREQPYQVVFKAKDDLFGDGLAATRVARFRVKAVSEVKQPGAGIGTLSLFPNPVIDEVTIQLPEALEEPATLQIFDFQGKVLASELISGEATRKQLDLRDLPEGFYFIKIQSVTKGKLQGSMIKIGG